MRGFTMSQTSTVLGEIVTFTLDIANSKEGETLEMEFCADNWTETFELTAQKNVFNLACSQDGDCSINVHIAGGEYCSAQILTVEADKAHVEDASSLSNDLRETVSKVRSVPGGVLDDINIADVCAHISKKLSEIPPGKDNKSTYRFKLILKENRNHDILILDKILSRINKYIF